MDYSKAFDTVKRKLLVDILQSLDVDQAELQLLTSHRCVDEYQTRSTTRMCGFPIFICLVYRNDYEGIRGYGGVIIGGTVVNNLRYIFYFLNLLCGISHGDLI